MSKQLDSFLRKELRKTVFLGVVAVAVLAWAGYRLL
jgi:hypothetical protein